MYIHSEVPNLKYYLQAHNRAAIFRYTEKYHTIRDSWKLQTVWSHLNGMYLKESSHVLTAM